MDVGADPALPNAFGWTALMIARYNSSILCPALEALTPDVALSPVARAFQSIRDSELEQLREVVSEIGLHAVDRYGYSLLMRAAGKSKETAALLLDLGVDVNATAGKLTALGFTVANSQTETARLLLESGAEANVDGHSYALYRAACENNAEIATLLLEAGANPNSEFGGISVLSAAIMRGPDVVDLLLRKGADPNCSYHGSSSLFLAIEKKRPKALHALLSAGADPNWSDPKGWTALDKMSLYFGADRDGCVRALLAAGADPQGLRFKADPEVASLLIHFQTHQHLKENTGKSAGVITDEGLAKYAPTLEAYRLSLWVDEDVAFAGRLVANGAPTDNVGPFSPLFPAIELLRIRGRAIASGASLRNSEGEMVLFVGILCALAATLYGLASFASRSTRQVAEGARRTKVADLEEGRFAVRGEIVAIQAIQSPLDGAECVFFEHADYGPSAVGTSLVRLETGRTSQGRLFYIDDGSGRVLVNPDITHIEAAMIREDGGLSIERRLRVGEEVEVVGSFSRVDPGSSYRDTSYEWMCIDDELGPPRLTYRTLPGMEKHGDDVVAFLRGASGLLAAMAVLLLVLISMVG